MAQEKPTVRECRLRYPVGVASLGSAEGCALETTLEETEMIREQQAIEELGVLREDPAYRSGWEDGRFGPPRTFPENPNLAGWAGHEERLAYYRGHRDGRRARGTPAEG
ncbi:MAG: hypothetical protein AVDCRST_MAG02-1450 [uncultured Rubrobacteraceae bacterium]|uniref:Uncharacterized protein n=1 Tax=uncultured Rubrobacteraceae bacterium TaxID=349277 RepID=A0A6J4R212_9ACTN|nr:MAG: hypothetical protein AVDCRST_MAG01-01-591 [uncultured Rubrobacteraceae bacterium]CAA9454879.1 MAG: hypothetical protein AVDCRST_MAG02-1450 [uncultured Rubrobacteraceae bacterium]